MNNLDFQKIKVLYRKTFVDNSIMLDRSDQDWDILKNILSGFGLPETQRQACLDYFNK